MNVNLELYKIFYVVAETKNITKASEILNISQPAVTKHIKNLEDQLGNPLFIRTKKGVILTDEGREFYNYISKAMEYIYNAENKFKDIENLIEKGVKALTLLSMCFILLLTTYIIEVKKCFRQALPESTSRHPWELPLQGTVTNAFRTTFWIPLS